MLYKKTHGAYLTTKGWNSRLITAWLADACSDALGKLPPNDELILTSHAMWLDPNLDCGSQYPDNSTVCLFPTQDFDCALFGVVGKISPIPETGLNCLRGGDISLKLIFRFFKTKE